MRDMTTIDATTPPPAGDNFVLKVKGDTMRDEGILDGDLVIACRREHHDGDLVVAAVRGSITAMRIYAEGPSRFRLQPSNRELPPLFVDAHECVVQGVVVGLMRRF